MMVGGNEVDDNGNDDIAMMTTMTTKTTMMTKMLEGKMKMKKAKINA